MNTSEVLVLAFLIGVIAGLRSMTAPAAIAWGSHLGLLTVRNSNLVFMGSTVAVALFSILAVIELIVDKLPSTPSRTKPAGLVARMALGGLAGAVIAFSGSQSMGIGWFLGAAGGLAGAFAGQEARAQIVKSLKLPDWQIALCEDLIAILGAILIITRF